MATLIRNEGSANHNINKYTFKSLSNGDDEFQSLGFQSALLGGSSEDTLEQQEETKATKEFTEEDNPNRRASDIDSSSMSRSSKDALIESLMKKTDEMSSNFIKLQMKLEDKEAEHTAALEAMKTKSYDEGLAAGIKKAKEETEENLKDGIAKFADSVKTLENKAKEYEVALENIKADLISAAIDIAGEVIANEIAENSSVVAKKLSDGLIKDLQSASKITLKVNPKDHGAISEHVGALSHIQIISDSAVSAGGVIAISDAGNIDSQISKRFERVKKAALSE